MTYAAHVNALNVIQLTGGVEAYKKHSVLGKTKALPIVVMKS